MKKQERQGLVKELLEAGTDENLIIEKVVAASGAKEATVKGDIIAMLEPDDESTEGKIVEIDLPKAKPHEDKFKYEVPADEMKATAHVYQEDVRFHPETGDRLSKGCSQKYDRQGWENMRTVGPSLGYSIIPLHIPEGWPDKIEPRKTIGKVSAQRPDAK